MREGRKKGKGGGVNERDRGQADMDPAEGFV